MRKLVLFFAMLGFMPAFADDITDVTGYLANPSFEEDDISTLPKDNTRGAYTAKSVVNWVLTGSYGVSDIMTANATATDNNFGAPGTPSDGSQMYYIRNAWSASNASLVQGISLPPGKYKLTVDNKCITESTHSAKLIAGANEASLTFHSSMPSKWDTTELFFTLKDITTLAIGIDVNFGSGSGGSILIDNFRLYRLPDDYVVPTSPTEKDVESPTEGVITNEFVGEEEMMRDLLQMLANFGTYLVNDFQEAQYPNRVNEACGCFKGENTMANDEKGVRPNADLSMICAFLVKYAKPVGIALPTGVTWEKIEDMAMKSLVFAYSTHKANKLKVCSGNNYWGSLSTSDNVWESSLWAMSVAFSAYFQWDKLTEAQKGYIYNLLKAECNYELNRTIPTGYSGDTKAEENGWEADVLAATLGLFPNDELAPQWFERMRLFAANSYSHYSDASNYRIVDEWYDNKTWADLHKGCNLYADWTLQNHNLFHTSYQNVVMQELGEAALALKMFQGANEKWKSNALQHNNQEVMDNVLNWLALADGELAMPNGNDWSLFLYDQITSYSTQACFQRDPNALLLENLAYKQIKARQATTTDGSWLLRADVGARRMGVEAHRVMMTFLMHKMMSTADLEPTTWKDFRNAHKTGMLFPCQNIVRGYTPYRFSCFSWSEGLKSYTGYFASDKADKNKIVVPYRANNTGNITGWYEVSGKGTNATPVVSGIYQFDPGASSWVMNGELSVNDGALDNRFAIFSTMGNAILYLDYVTANTGCTITAEKGGLLAISTDELTKLKRTLYYENNNATGKDDAITWTQSDGSQQVTFNSDWVNIDNELGVIGLNGKKMAFGDRGANNSIYTSKLYPMYGNGNRTVKTGDVVDARNLVYYSDIDTADTRVVSQNIEQLRPLLPEGWNGIIAPDPSGTYYCFISNFKGKETAKVEGITIQNFAAPIFHEETVINDNKASVTFNLRQNNSLAEQMHVFVAGSNVKARLEKHEARVFRITATEDTEVTIWGMTGNWGRKSLKLDMKQGDTYRIKFYNTHWDQEVIDWDEEEEADEDIDMTGYIVNPKFEGNTRTGWEMKKSEGNDDTKYNTTEFWNNTSFSLKQTVKGLPAGKYRLSCQGYYRAGSNDDAASSHAAGTEKLNASLYVQPAGDTKISKPFQSVIDEAGKMGTLGVSTSQGYVPNSMDQAAQYFKAGLYDDNVVEFTVKEGQDVEIGVEKSNKIDNDWTIFTNFRLYYLIEEGGETGIKYTTTVPFAKSGTYTLSGVRVADTSSLPHGLYIRNGKKILHP